MNLSNKFYIYYTNAIKPSFIFKDKLCAIKKLNSLSWNKTGYIKDSCGKVICTIKRKKDKIKINEI